MEGITTTINLFETASRQKFRYPHRGQCNTEDLWDLSLNELDAVFKALNAESKRANEESLLSTKSNEDTILDMKIAIVKHIVTVKIAEADAAKTAAANRAQLHRIEELIATKQNEALQSMSIDELMAMAEALKK